MTVPIVCILSRLEPSHLVPIFIFNSGLIHLRISMRKNLSQPQPLTSHEELTFLDLPTIIAAKTASSISRAYHLLSEH